MRSPLRAAVGLVALSVFGLAALPSMAAVRAERELLGIRIWRPDKSVLARFGQPSRIEPLGGGAAAAPMGMGPMGPMGMAPAPAPSGDQQIAWVYEHKTATDVFVFNKDHRVVQIQTSGTKGGAATSHGVRLGDPLFKVLRAYGATSEVSNMGNVMTLDYSHKYHCSFQLTDLGRGYFVTSITVALQELTQPMVAPAAPGMGMPGMGPTGPSLPGAPGGMPGYGGPPPGYGGPPPGYGGPPTGMPGMPRPEPIAPGP